MHGAETANPSLVIAIALAAGIVAQALAQHLRVPGIVMLVATGILLGPDGIGLIDTQDLGAGFRELVGFAIAVILFEGGLNLELRRLRREAVVIRRLVTVGALITWIGASVAAHYILGWSWTLAVPFGSLVIVTGPTVITPILRRARVRHNIETILEAEGVFIDAVGAIIAVVVLEVVVGFSGESLALGFISLPTRLVTGALVGVLGGYAIALLLRVRGVVPDGFENVFTLTLAWAVFHGSNALSSESGIVAVIIAGMVVGNSRTEVKNDLKEFKEQLTVMLIGMLFVLLAADVRVAEVFSLGMGGVLVVAALMFVVRPLSVFLCTLGTGNTIREKLFLSWLAPRGIIAAAVAALFYDRMTTAGIPGGMEMRALVFLVIGVTVVFQGGTGRFVARWLGLRRPTNNGYVVLGADPLALTLARVLRDGGEEVVIIDANPDACGHAASDGFRVYNGNALEERILVAAQMDTRRGVVALLGNDGVNLLFARKARNEYKVPRSYVAVARGTGAITDEMMGKTEALVLFGQRIDVVLWSVRVRRNLTRLSLWRYEGVDPAAAPSDAGTETAPGIVDAERATQLIPLATLDRGGAVAPFSTDPVLQKGDSVFWLLFTERETEAIEWLNRQGWTRVPDETTDGVPGGASPAT